MTDERVVCRTPTKGKDGVTRIPRWKYDAIHGAIVDVVGGAGDDGFAWGDLSAAVHECLTPSQLAEMGSVGWHTISVKLNKEVTGELERLKGVTPQRIRLMR